MSGSRTVLEVRPAQRLLLVAGTVIAIVSVAVGLWLRGDPDPLPVDDRTVAASTPVEQPLYLGVFTVPDDFGRTLQLSGVKINATSNAAVSLEPLLCRGGAVGVTTQPEAFCADLVNPEGQDLGPGDSIVIQAVCAEPAVAVVDPVRLAFRENLQWGTHPAGAGAVIRFLPR